MKQPAEPGASGGQSRSSRGSAASRSAHRRALVSASSWVWPTRTTAPAGFDSAPLVTHEVQWPARSSEWTVNVEELIV